MSSVRGRVVAVTGGAAGIGRAIAEQLAAAGARVAIGDRDAVGARRAASEISGEVTGLVLDVTDSAAFAGFLDAVETQWGTVDVLVNNAGVMWVGDFDTEPEDVVRRQLDVNLHGVIRGVQAAAPRMRARGTGQIVTIASAASKVSPPGEATYAATKHGVLGYLRAVRAELRGSGVELSVIMPGVVDTDLARGTATGAVRLLQPSEVARAVVSVIERPRFEVTMPRHLGRALALAELVPQVVRDFILDRMVPNQITGTDQTARQHYQAGPFRNGTAS
ncbi:SDR family oxidoreductase [Mycobacterium sp. M1]|uniref:SDR family oxidoreductase n=1 Tax=Mycolicibacter acidiphilus TaxID=2835306 RepID=A0ABS5RPJ5_9MYCO|nr:SDR family oxidoreductase [Mycolicibacter acidiphilus]MBS9536114.1 SDR family oxidoreductase [Mycolicibacter acidiphilus]